MTMTNGVKQGQPLTINSALLARAMLAAQMGQQFGGKRDVYEAAGYDRIIQLDNYLATYKRGDLAKRLIEIYPDETWRKEPIIYDGDERYTAETTNPFLLAWDQIATGGMLFDDGETAGGLLAQLRYLDAMVGLGHYGILVFGLRDGLELSQPTTKGGMGGPQDLLYARPYPERFAKILEVERNKSNPRYGKPTLYQVTMRTGANEATETVNVHWSRVLHVAEGGDGIYGLPRLEAVWNRLTDLLKIFAATGEGAWRLMSPNYTVEAQEGYEAPDSDSPEWEAFSGQVDDFVHSLRRWLSLEGYKINELTGDLKDPGPAIEANLDMIAGATGIPKRKLMGSERGELASTQDAEAWADLIETRQRNYAWPNILLPCINRLRWYGVLPAPKVSVSAEWPALLESDKVAQADAADKAAGALQKAGVAVDPSDFVTTYLPDLDPTKVTLAPVGGGGMALNSAFFPEYP
jgi:uncharacterized protein